MTTNPRIAPAERSTLDQKTIDIIDRSHVPGAPAANVFTTMAQNERLYRRWAVFSGAMFRGKLPTRDRELMILRAALHANSRYEWAQHNLVAREVGLTTEDIERTTRNELDGWPPNEAALLRACDEIERDACISESTWGELSAHYTTEQLVEICFLPGSYRMLAGFLNSAQVQLEPEFPATDLVPFRRLG